MHTSSTSHCDPNLFPDTHGSEQNAIFKQRCHDYSLTGSCTNLSQLTKYWTFSQTFHGRLPKTEASVESNRHRMDEWIGSSDIYLHEENHTAALSLAIWVSLEVSVSSALCKVEHNNSWTSISLSKFWIPPFQKYSRSDGALGSVGKMKSDLSGIFMVDQRGSEGFCNADWTAWSGSLIMSHGGGGSSSSESLLTSSPASLISCSESWSKSRMSLMSSSLHSATGMSCAVLLPVAGMLKFQCSHGWTRPASMCDLLISIPMIMVLQTLSTLSLLWVASCTSPMWLNARSQPAELAIMLRMCIEFMVCWKSVIEGCHVNGFE